MPFSSLLPRLQPLARMVGAGFLEALYPLECVGCGRTGRVICDRCAVALPALRPPFCRVCSAPGDFSLCPQCSSASRYFEGVRAPFLYEGTVRQAILALKYGGMRAAAGQLGDLLGRYFDDNTVPCDVLAPVPMHPTRRRDRGYNQAELLARRVAEIVEVPYRPDLLTRTRKVEPQAGVDNAAQRIVNVAGSVGVSAPSEIRDARIVLVDDVATTGSTLEVCARALKEAGAASVWGLTLAIAGRHSPTE